MSFPSLCLAWPQPPVILQTEATELWPACLGMVAGYYGRCTDLAESWRRFRSPSMAPPLAS